MGLEGGKNISGRENSLCQGGRQEKAYTRLDALSTAQMNRVRYKGRLLGNGPREVPRQGPYALTVQRGKKLEFHV